MKYFYLSLKILIISYILIALILYFFQRKLLYFPQKGVNLVYEKEISIKNKEIVLRGWVINDGKDNAILYYGGNAEKIEYNIPQFKKIFRNYTVYLMCYRGYGMSEGIPTETNLYNDAVLIYDKIKKNHNNISLIGRSLGCSIGMYVASKKSANKIALITPFDSIEKVAQQIFWMYPMSILLKDKYNSSKYAEKISSKTLIMIAENDEVITRKRSESLISMFKSDNLTVEIIKGAGHNSISIFPEFKRSLGLFFNGEKNESNIDSVSHLHIR
ncbi:MAG TPA: hypothetical protein QF753_05145 [Victivallales bacterium]|nr:hypothetical protein [Victivallales bacterium]